MTTEDIKDYILNSSIVKEWHFFNYHFKHLAAGVQKPLAKSLIEVLTECENVCSGVGKDYVDKIAAINGKERDSSHFDQLLQVLAELMIVHKALTFSWSDEQKFIYEPTSGNSKKNPELLVSTPDYNIGIEVKAPKKKEHELKRAACEVQLPARTELINIVDKKTALLPRDNPIKDFLISANEKFREFKKTHNNFIGVLVIVGDDFIYEPISALLSRASGLFTENSFAKDSQGQPKLFENIDVVILTRHLTSIATGTAIEHESLMPDLYRHPLDYGRAGEFPFKVFIPNPNNIKTVTIPDSVMDCYQTYLPLLSLGAEYSPKEYVMWV